PPQRAPEPVDGRRVSARGAGQLIDALPALFERFDQPQFLRRQERSAHLVAGQELPEAPPALRRVRGPFRARRFQYVHGCFSSGLLRPPPSVPPKVLSNASLAVAP